MQPEATKSFFFFFNSNSAEQNSLKCWKQICCGSLQKGNMRTTMPLHFAFRERKCFCTEQLFQQARVGRNYSGLRIEAKEDCHSAV